MGSFASKRKKQQVKERSKFICSIPDIYVTRAYSSMAYRMKVKEDFEYVILNEMTDGMRRFMRHVRQNGILYAATKFDLHTSHVQFITMKWFCNKIWARDPDFYINKLPEHFFSVYFNEKNSSLSLSVYSGIDRVKSPGGNLYTSTSVHGYTINGVFNQLYWTSHAVDRLKERYAIHNTYEYAMIMHKTILRMCLTDPSFHNGNELVTIFAPVAKSNDKLDKASKLLTGNVFTHADSWVNVYLDIMGEKKSGHTLMYKVGVAPMEIIDGKCILKTILLPGFFGTEEHDILTKTDRSRMANATGEKFATGEYNDILYSLHKDIPQCFLSDKEYDICFAIGDKEVEPLFKDHYNKQT